MATRLHIAQISHIPSAKEPFHLHNSLPTLLLPNCETDPILQHNFGFSRTLSLILGFNEATSSKDRERVEPLAACSKARSEIVFRRRNRAGVRRERERERWISAGCCERACKFTYCVSKSGAAWGVERAGGERATGLRPNHKRWPLKAALLVAANTRSRHTLVIIERKKSGGRWRLIFLLCARAYYGAIKSQIRPAMRTGYFCARNILLICGERGWCECEHKN